MDSLYEQQDPHSHCPNRGQWHPNISYQIDIPGGDMYLEKGGFTYNLNNLGEAYDHHHHGEEHEEFHGQVVKTSFIGANSNPIFEEINQSSHYENYFIGNDTTKWKSIFFFPTSGNFVSNFADNVWNFVDKLIIDFG